MCRAAKQFLPIFEQDLDYAQFLSCQTGFGNFISLADSQKTTMLTHQLTVMGGSDSGANMRLICDGSAQTFMLTSWVRESPKSDPCHLPLEFVVKKQSRDTARLFGMYDRGTLEPGMRADINLIDFSALQIDTPRMINDLPAGMPRLMQTAQGSVATMVNGETRRENAALTGARPGKFGS